MYSHNNTRIGAKGVNSLELVPLTVVARLLMLDTNATKTVSINVLLNNFQIPGHGNLLGYEKKDQLLTDGLGDNCVVFLYS